MWVGEWGCRVRWGNTSVCRMTVCAGWLCVQDGCVCRMAVCAGWLCVQDGCVCRMALAAWWGVNGPPCLSLRAPLPLAWMVAGHGHKHGRYSLIHNQGACACT